MGGFVRDAGEVEDPASSARLPNVVPHHSVVTAYANDSHCFVCSLCGLLDLTLGNGSLTESVLGAAVNVLQETHTASSCGAATDGLHGPVVPVCWVLGVVK